MIHRWNRENLNFLVWLFLIFKSGADFCYCCYHGNGFIKIWHMMEFIFYHITPTNFIRMSQNFAPAKGTILAYCPVLKIRWGCILVAMATDNFKKFEIKCNTTVFHFQNLMVIIVWHQYYGVTRISWDLSNRLRAIIDPILFFGGLPWQYIWKWNYPILDLRIFKCLSFNNCTSQKLHILNIWCPYTKV